MPETKKFPWKTGPKDYSYITIGKFIIVVIRKKKRWKVKIAGLTSYRLSGRMSLEEVRDFAIKRLRAICWNAMLQL